VGRVNLVKDRETGRARGFAFVEMPNDEEAAKAVAGLDGKQVGGRNLKVNEARPKKPRARLDSRTAAEIVAEPRAFFKRRLPGSRPPASGTPLVESAAGLPRQRIEV